MKATVRLMNDGDVSGPVETIDVPKSRKGQERKARAWADGQIGRPWDTLTVTPEGDDRAFFEIEL